MSPSVRVYTVGVFDDERHPTRRPLAYVRTFSPEWPGCCLHEVAATIGEDAKRRAIQEHTERCRGFVCPDCRAVVKPREPHSHCPECGSLEHGAAYCMGEDGF